MKYFISLISLVALLGSNAFAAAVLSASVTAVPVTATINQLVNFNVAISNTGSTAVNLTQLGITASYNGATTSRVPWAPSLFTLGPNAPVVTLAANATTNVPMQAVFFAPSTGVTGTGTGKFYIGAYFYASDGSVTSAGTAAALPVNPLPYPASQL